MYLFPFQWQGKETPIPPDAHFIIILWALLFISDCRIDVLVAARPSWSLRPIIFAAIP